MAPARKEAQLTTGLRSLYKARKFRHYRGVTHLPSALAVEPVIGNAPSRPDSRFGLAALKLLSYSHPPQSILQ
jgi:hypothetical protein